MSESTSGDPVEREPVSQRVIEAVAAETGREATEVGPLYHVIDPDALDRLFSATGAGRRAEGYVAFAFGGCEVVVRGNGDVDVTKRDAGADLVDDVDEVSRVEGYEEA